MLQSPSSVVSTPLPGGASAPFLIRPKRALSLHIRPRRLGILLQVFVDINVVLWAASHLVHGSATPGRTALLFSRLIQAVPSKRTLRLFPNYCPQSSDKPACTQLPTHTCKGFCVYKLSERNAHQETHFALQFETHVRAYIKGSKNGFIKQYLTVSAVSSFSFRFYFYLAF